MIGPLTRGDASWQFEIKRSLRRSKYESIVLTGAWRGWHLDCGVKIRWQQNKRAISGDFIRPVTGVRFRVRLSCTFVEESLSVLFISTFL
jgi:hypothetical protein